MEKLEDYSRTGSSKKAAMNAAAEAIALSGHCVGFIWCSFRAASTNNLLEFLWRSSQPVRIWRLDPCMYDGSFLEIPLQIIHVPDSRCCMNSPYRSVYANTLRMTATTVRELGCFAKSAKGKSSRSGRSEEPFHSSSTVDSTTTPPTNEPVADLHSLVNMSDTELLAYCGQQLLDMRFVCVVLMQATSTEPRLPSNGLPVGDLSDYSTLLESLQELRHTILSHRNDQIPINRLPVEILVLICKLTLPPDPEFTTPDNERVFCVTKLTHVCRHWRSVLVSSPVLWTSFHVVKSAPKFVAECLQRSRTSPIHVSFKWDNSDPDFDSPPSSITEDDGSVVDDGGVVDDDADHISSSEPDYSDDETFSHSTFSIYPDHRDVNYSWTAYLKEAHGYHHLMQHSHRIATLDISLPTPGEGEDEEEDNSFACGLLFYPFPALQTLKLRCSQGGQGSIPRVILDEHITTVKNLLLENILPTQIMDLPLNITSLNLRITGSDLPMDTGLFLRFLEKNRNLRSLTLHDYKFLPLPGTVAPVALNNLCELDVLAESATFLQHLAALPLGPQSFFRMERAHWRLSLLAKNSAVGTSASVSSRLLNADPDPDPEAFLSVISGVFGSGWEEATQVVVVIPVEGWEREFVDQFLDRLARLDDFSIECEHDRMGPWFDSLAASKERCPKLRRVHLLGIAPEYCPNAVRSVRKLVKRRSEDGIPLEVVEQTGLSPSAVGIWNDLYNRWQIEDYLKMGDS